MSTNKPDDATTADLARELAEFSLGLSRALRQEQNPSTALSMMEVSVLFSVYENPGITTAELARQYRMAPQSMRPWVVELLTKEMISRTSDDRDRRAHRLAVTDVGRASLTGERERHMAALTSNINEHFLLEDQARLLEAVRELKVLLQTT